MGRRSKTWNIHIYIHVYIYIYTHIYIHIYTYVHVYIYGHMQMSGLPGDETCKAQPGPQQGFCRVGLRGFGAQPFLESRIQEREGHEAGSLPRGCGAGWPLGQGR